MAQTAAAAIKINNLEDIHCVREAVLGALLVTGSVIIYATNSYRFFETDLFATIPLIQSLPFVSAIALVWLERLDIPSASGLLCSGRPVEFARQSKTMLERIKIAEDAE